MRFSIVLTTLSLVLSATAAVVNKRTVTSATQTCINDLVATDNNIPPAIDALNAYSPTGNLTTDLLQYLPFSNYHYSIRTNLTHAETSCCSISSTVSDEDANAVLSELGIFVPHFVTLLDTIAAKEPALKSISVGYTLTRAIITVERPSARNVFNCVAAFTPSGLTSNVQQYAATLENAFGAAFTAYNITSN